MDLQERFRIGGTGGRFLEHALDRFAGFELYVQTCRPNDALRVPGSCDIHLIKVGSGSIKIDLRDHLRSLIRSIKYVIPRCPSRIIMTLMPMSAGSDGLVLLKKGLLHGVGTPTRRVQSQAKMVYPYPYPGLATAGH